MSVSPKEINQKLRALPEEAKNRIVHTIDNHSQTSIDLSYCNLRAKDMVVIADLLNLFWRITTLNVEGNKIGDEGMELIKEMLIRNIKLKKSEAEIRKTARILAQAMRIESGPAFFKDSPIDLLAKIAGYSGNRDVHSELDSY